VTPAPEVSAPPALTRYAHLTHRQLRVIARDFVLSLAKAAKLPTHLHSYGRTVVDCRNPLYRLESFVEGELHHLTKTRPLPNSYLPPLEAVLLFLFLLYNPRIVKGASVTVEAY